MTLEEKKDVLRKYADKLEKSIKTELTVRKEIEDDKLTLETLKSKKQNGDAFDNTVYVSFDEWIAQMEKEIKTSESTLTNIEFKKIELEAIKAFIA